MNGLWTLLGSPFGIVLLPAAIVAVVMLAAVVSRIRRAVRIRHQRLPLRTVLRGTGPSEAIPDGDLGADALAMVCRFCSTGRGLCACAGHCGRQGCRGTAIVIDLASALQRITREGRRG